MSYLKTLSKLISPPDITQLESSIEELLMLQAIKVDTISEQMCVSITDEGESLLHFPIEPTYAK
jgi:HrpA-like RNA helicase